MTTQPTPAGGAPTPLRLADVPGAQWLRFAVVDADNYVVSLHMHPNSAERVIRESPRTDLRRIEVTWHESRRLEPRATVEDEARAHAIQDNDIAGMVVDAMGEHDPDLFVPIHVRYGVAYRVWKAGYRKTADGTAAAVLPRAVQDVVDERARQDAKWGEQSHPDGTGPSTTPLLADGISNPAAPIGPALAFALHLSHRFRTSTDAAAQAGTVTWRHILLEEVFEALAEEHPLALRTELVQIAAVATQWAEAIDRRGSEGGTPA